MFLYWTCKRAIEWQRWEETIHFKNIYISFYYLFCISFLFIKNSSKIMQKWQPRRTKKSKSIENRPFITKRVKGWKAALVAVFVSVHHSAEYLSNLLLYTQLIRGHCFDSEITTNQNPCKNMCVFSPVFQELWGWC